MNPFFKEYQSYFKRVNSILSRIEKRIEETNDPETIKFLLFRLRCVEDIVAKKQESVFGE